MLCCHSQYQVKHSCVLFGRYLVTHLMGADLNNIVKCQKLTDDHVQFLIYQILRGLKVKLPFFNPVMNTNRNLFNLM